MAFHVKSGASQPWYSPITLKLNYAQKGAELRNFKNSKGKLKSALRSTAMYHRPGLSWTRRAFRFFPYAIPSNCIPSVSRYMAYPKPDRLAESLGVFASKISSAFMRFYGEVFQRPNYLVDTVKSMPWPTLSIDTNLKLKVIIDKELQARRLTYQNHEPFHDFLIPAIIDNRPHGAHSIAFNELSLIGSEAELEIAKSYGLNKQQIQIIERDLKEAISYIRGPDKISDDTTASDEDADFVLDYSPVAQAEAQISYLLGCPLGRWDIRYATGERQPPELPDPFDPLPVCPPGMLQSADGLPLAETQCFVSSMQ